MTNVAGVVQTSDVEMQYLVALYEQLHRYPELAFAETETARLAAAAISSHGWEVTENVGRTGVVGVMTQGRGPTVLLRADMDALPVQEQTSLDYASVATGLVGDTEVPVSHACGHDIHVACLVGAARWFAHNRQLWAGTIVVVFQPAEENGFGAREMLRDGLFERFPRPDVLLAQHVGPGPHGLVGTCGGTVMSATDALAIRFYGRGGHGSKPESAIDPILMASHFVTRVQGIVSREVAASDAVVVTVGSVHAGTAAATIPDLADLEVNIRSRDETVRAKVLTAIERIAQSEARASGAVRDPAIRSLYSNPAMINDDETRVRVAEAHRREFGSEMVVDIPPLSASEDFGVLSVQSGIPSAYWFIGGTDPQEYLTALTRGTVDIDIPPNHSPLFAPVPAPTIKVGVRALVSAACEWLRPSSIS